MTEEDIERLNKIEERIEKVTERRDACLFFNNLEEAKVLNGNLEVLNNLRDDIVFEREALIERRLGALWGEYLALRISYYDANIIEKVKIKRKIKKLTPQMNVESARQYVINEMKEDK